MRPLLAGDANMSNPTIIDGTDFYPPDARDGVMIVIRDPYCTRSRTCKERASSSHASQSSSMKAYEDGVPVGVVMNMDMNNMNDV